MSRAEQPAAPVACEHHWVSAHEPGHLLYWVKSCSLCHKADWENLDRQVREFANAEIASATAGPEPAGLNPGETQAPGSGTDRSAERAPLPTSGPLTAAEADRFRAAAHTLGIVIDRISRSMEAARIEMLQSGPEKAMQWILSSLPDVDDNPEDQHWDGRESAVEWLDRTHGSAS